MRLRRPARSPAARAYEEAEIAPPETPWREAGYAVVDLETTGLDPKQDEIISFAAVPIDAGRIKVGAVSTLMIRPSRMPEAETIRIHGLRPQDLAEAPELRAVLDSVLEALTGRVLVAHAAWVERGFLSGALEAGGAPPPPARGRHRRALPARAGPERHGRRGNRAALRCSA